MFSSLSFVLVSKFPNISDDFPQFSSIFYILLQVAVPIYVPYFYSLQQTTFVVVVVKEEHM